MSKPSLIVLLKESICLPQAAKYWITFRKNSTKSKTWMQSCLSRYNLWKTSATRYPISSTQTLVWSRNRARKMKLITSSTFSHHKWSKMSPSHARVKAAAFRRTRMPKMCTLWNKEMKLYLKVITRRKVRCCIMFREIKPLSNRRLMRGTSLKTLVWHFSSTIAQNLRVILP